MKEGQVVEVRNRTDSEDSLLRGKEGGKGDGRDKIELAGIARDASRDMRCAVENR
jgi:hypothetical protein